MKKLLSMFLVLCMVVSLSVPMAPIHVHALETGEEADMAELTGSDESETIAGSETTEAPTVPDEDDAADAITAPVLDDSDEEISDGQMLLAEETHSHDDGAVFEALEELGGELTEGNYYLTGDLAAPGVNVSISGTVNLCLNGHTLNLGTNSFQVKGGAEFSVCDCAGGGQVKSTYTAVRVFDGTFNVMGGSLRNNGAVLIDIEQGGFGTVNVYGGEIGAMIVRRDGTANIYGGTISTSRTAVSIDDGAVVNIYGGTIAGPGEDDYGVAFIGSRGGSLNLSGTPSITGDAAGIFKGYAENRIDAEGYCGDAIVLELDYTPTIGEVIVSSVDEVSRFTLSDKKPVHIAGGNLCYGEYTEPHFHGTEGFQPLGRNLPITMSDGSYVLTTESYPSAQDVKIAGNVKLCLNGQKLNLGNYKFYLTNGASLTICDCIGDGRVESKMDAVYVNNSRFRLEGGTITGTQFSSATVSCLSGGKVALAGGVLDGLTKKELSVTDVNSLDVTGYQGHLDVALSTGKNWTDGDIIASGVTDDVTFAVTRGTEAVNTYVNAQNQLVIGMNPGHTHVFGEWVEEIAATCVSTGTLGHKDCGLCMKHFDADGEELEDLSIAIDPENHVGGTEIVNSKDPTDTEDGYTGDEVCKGCRTVLKPGEVIPAEKPAKENILVLDVEEMGHPGTVWVDGKPYFGSSLGEKDGKYHIELPDTECSMVTTYSYNQSSSDKHQVYPVGMRVWKLSHDGTTYSADELPAFVNILQYCGSSIRMTGTKGIRMITGVPNDQRNSLINGNLAGFTLEEYGTVIGFANEVGDELTLENGRSNFAYKRGVSDAIFAQADGRTQYTNVLVGFTMEQCSEDIAMRPYMKVKDSEGNVSVIYGGIVHRSIGYIAWQNRVVYAQGSDGYQYIWEIIKAVYGDNLPG